MAVHVRQKVQGGPWWVFARHKNKRKSWKVGSKRAADKFAEQIEAGLKVPKSLILNEEKDIPTLKAFWEDRKDVIRASIRRTTNRCYEGNFRLYILPAMGSLPLDEITTERVEDFVTGLMIKKLSKDSIRLAVASLRMLLNQAVQKGIIPRHTIAGVSKLYRQAPTKHEEIQPLTSDEVRLFLQKVAENSPYYYALFLTAIHTGLRAGELTGLQWGDINYAKQYLVVRRSIVEGKENKTKTDTVRHVPMTDAVIVELRKLRERRKGSTSPWIFSNQRGKPLELRNLVNRHYLKCLELAELEKRRFHDLRHTYASLRLNAGHSLWQVSKAMGHSDIRTTANIYGHLQPETDRTAINSLPAIDSPAEPLIRFKRKK